MILAFPQDSGIRLKHAIKTKMKTTFLRKNKWFIKDVLLFKNYRAVVDFTSGYIYRFGKFRFLSEEVRELYIDVNQSFLKDTSDHLDSASNDLSFEHLIDSRTLNKREFGSVRAEQVTQLYTLMLYKKMFDRGG